MLHRIKIIATDQCQLTGIGEKVDILGCSVSDYCSPMSTLWKNHGQYVKCVVYVTDIFVEENILTEEEADLLVEAATHSDMGK